MDFGLNGVVGDDLVDCVEFFEIFVIGIDIFIKGFEVWFFGKSNV